MAGIARILVNLLDILPDSFVQSAIDSLDRVDSFMGFLNFFIPFDLCVVIFQTWSIGMVAYFGYSIFSSKLFKFMV